MSSQLIETIRSNIIGDDQAIDGPYGLRRVTYADYTASGRSLKFIEDFITNQVINWSFSNDLVRIDVEFGVSYDSDPHKVMDIAKAATVTVDRVVAHRGVCCWITGFGASSIDLDIRFWIRDPQAGLTNVRGQVLLALWDAFKEAGVKIPFPHREIIMQTPVDVRVDSSSDPSKSE